MFEGFINKTLGSSDEVQVDNFDFTEEASKIAKNMINAVFVDLDVEIKVSFGLDLTNVFDSTSASRSPDPFLRINEFMVDGSFGLMEWSDSLDIDLEPSVTFGVAVSTSRTCSVT